MIGEGVPDADAVRRALEGDRGAFDLLVRRHLDPLYRHASRMVGDPDAAADLVQETFVRGYRKLDSCRDPGRVGSWLHRICANLCRDHLRDPRRDERSLDAAGPVSGGSSPQREAERRDVSGALEAALASLPVEQREAFLLKHLEGRTYPEMAEILDASVSALKMRVHRARDELQRLLEVHR